MSDYAESVKKWMKQSYALDCASQAYKKIGRLGLWPSEETLFNKYFQKNRPFLSVYLFLFSSCYLYVERGRGKVLRA